MRQMHSRGQVFIRLRQLLASTFVVLCALLVAAPAAARGSVRISNASPQEDDGRWKLKFTIDYGSIPHLAHMPMVFSFKQTAVYERSLTDDSGDKPIKRTIAMRNQTPKSVSMDVGFADAGGNIFKITKFSVKLRRENDFEAGEYMLTVKLASGGALGRPTRIRLLGDNKPVDRRAMDFGGKVGGGKAKPKPEEPTAGDTGPVANEDMGPDLSGIGDGEDGDVDGTGDSDPVETPPEVKAKQGGCGCHLAAPDHTNPWLATFAVLALAVGVCIRRQRRRMTLLDTKAS